MTASRPDSLRTAWTDAWEREDAPKDRCRCRCRDPVRPRWPGGSPAHNRELSGSRSGRSSAGWIASVRPTRSSSRSSEEWIATTERLATLLEVARADAGGRQLACGVTLTDDEIQELLAATRSATMARSARRAATPCRDVVRARPRRHLLRDQGQVQKAVNLRRDGDQLVWSRTGPPTSTLRGVAIEGSAEIHRRPGPLWRIGVNIWERYYGPYTDDLEPIVETMLNKRIAVRVRPHRLRSLGSPQARASSTGEPAGTTVTAPGRRAK